MAKRHHLLDAELVQRALLDDPEFLRRIVEGVLQHLLEAEITGHLEAHYQRSESGKGTTTVTSRGNSRAESRHPRAAGAP